MCPVPKNGQFQSEINHNTQHPATMLWIASLQTIVICFGFTLLPQRKLEIRQNVFRIFPVRNRCFQSVTLNSNPSDDDDSLARHTKKEEQNAADIKETKMKLEAVERAIKEMPEEIHEVENKLLMLVDEISKTKKQIEATQNDDLILMLLTREADLRWEKRSLIKEKENLMEEKRSLMEEKRSLMEGSII